jgi:hypothetical protein
MSKLSIFSAGSFTTILGGLAVFMLTGAKMPIRNGEFNEITVHRINVVEPDGTKRLIISNRAQFPGEFDQGKEVAREDRNSFAGILFLDEEGNENGGLIQKGQQTSDGKISAGLSLTFDRYKQDQALQLLHQNSESHSLASVKINDVPSYKVTSMEDIRQFKAEANKLSIDQQKAFWQRLSEEGRLSENRIYMGTTLDKASALSLKDAQGRTRMLLLVSADGVPEIRMLNEDGKVIKKILSSSSDTN